MAGPNDPQLLPKTTAKAQLTDNRLSALVASQGDPVTAYNPVTTVVQQTVAGTYTWTCPAGVTSARIQVWGAGAGGNGGNSTLGGDGGGGGAYSEEPAYPVVPGAAYAYQVGDGGDGAITNAGLGASGQASFFDIAGDAGGVFANGGNFKSPAGGPPSAGQRNPEQAISFNGGAGGGGGTQSTGGCGGGSSASPAGNGTSGATSSSSAGASGGSGGTDKGTGGNGGNSGVTGSDGGSPGAGGGGVGASAAPGGLVILSYSPVFSATYYGSDAVGGNASNRRLDTGNAMWQDGSSAGDGIYLGTMKSLMILPSSVASDLAAVTVDTVTLTMTNLTSWLSSGLTVQLGYSAATALPATFDGTTGVTAALTYNTPQGASHAQPVTDSLAAPLKAGTAKALVLGPGPAFDSSYYGSFAGAGDTGTPVLTIVGHTGAALIHSGDGADGEVRISYVTNGVAVAGIMPAAATDDAGHDFAAGYTGQTTAFQPGSSPANVETWHTVSSFSNNWAGTNVEYRLMPFNAVWVIGILDPSGVTGVFPSTVFTLPAGYRPASTQDHTPGFHASAGASAGIFYRAQTSGAIQVFNAATTSGALIADFFISLDY